MSYGQELGAGLRAIRTQQGLSLHGVEQKSHGRWKAVVVGSYERGDRAVTAQRLLELAAFYRVPVTELLPHAVQQAPPAPPPAAARVVLDLQRLHAAAPEQRTPLARYAAAIQRQRGDYNGRVLSLRAKDLRALSLICPISPGEVTEQLLSAGVLETGGQPPAARRRSRRVIT